MVGARGRGRSLASMRSVDVVVVGAGPAGTAAAITAGPRRARGRRGRQGHVPPRQDLRRRAHHRRLRHLEHLGLDPGRRRVVDDREGLLDALPLRSHHTLLPARRQGPVPRDRPPPRPGLRTGGPGPQGRRRRARGPRDDRRAETADAVELEVERWAPCGPGGPSPPMACGHRCASSSASPPTATSASGTRSASTCRMSVRRRQGTCTSRSTPTSCPATSGRSRCPTAGPTSASGSSAAARTPSRT